MPGVFDLDQLNVTLVVHVDDIRTVSTENALRKVKKKLEEVYKGSVSFLDQDDITSKK